MSPSNSIFSRVFSYIEREKHSPLENFLIEILAYSLINDQMFRTNFFKLFPSLRFNNEVISVTTQKNYEGVGRPDIEIRFNSTMVFIECKVESPEGRGQLEKYIQSLHKEKIQSKHFIYLTKYYEIKDFPKTSVITHQTRWIDIYKIIDEENTQISKEFKSFLKENNMENVKNFSLQDLNAMKSISVAISKMDEVLEQVKPEFAKVFGAFSKDSSRSSRLWDNYYANFVTLKHKGVFYNIHVGFFWDDPETEIPHVGISIGLPSKLNNSILSSKLDTLERKKWVIYEYDIYPDFFYYTATKPLTEFIDKETDNVLAIKKFILEKLKDLLAIRDGKTKILTR